MELTVQSRLIVAEYMVTHPKVTLRAVCERGVVRVVYVSLIFVDLSLCPCSHDRVISS